MKTLLKAIVYPFLSNQEQSKIPSQYATVGGCLFGIIFGIIIILIPFTIVYLLNK